jgi:hypothetical protein
VCLCFVISDPLSEPSPIQFLLHGEWNRSPFNIFEPNGTHHHRRKRKCRVTERQNRQYRQLPSPYMVSEKGFFQHDVMISSLSHTRSPTAMRITFSGRNRQSCITDPLHCLWSQLRFPLFLTWIQTRRLSYKIVY